MDDLNIDLSYQNLKIKSLSTLCSHNLIENHLSNKKLFYDNVCYVI
jgi:hypothetical protein